MKLHRLIRAVRALLEEDLRRERADRIAREAQRRYEALCAENAADSKALRAHTFRRIYPAAAVYLTMREDGIGQERAVWYVRGYFQQLSAIHWASLAAAKSRFIFSSIPSTFMERRPVIPSL